MDFLKQLTYENEKWTKHFDTFESVDDTDDFMDDDVSDISEVDTHENMGAYYDDSSTDTKLENTLGKRKTDKSPKKKEKKSKSMRQYTSTVCSDMLDDSMTARENSFDKDVASEPPKKKKTKKPKKLKKRQRENNFEEEEVIEPPSKRKNTHDRPKKAKKKESNKKHIPIVLIRRRQTGHGNETK